MTADPLPAAGARSGRIQRILVVVNRTAGGIQRDPSLIDALRRQVRDRGDIAVTGSRDEVIRVVARARLHGVDTIASCGGDGTNMCTATAVATVYRGAPWPRLAILSGGTLNTVAHNMGCAGPAPLQLGALLTCELPAVDRRPLLGVNALTGFIFGAQTIARILDVYYANHPSPLSAALLATRIVASAALGSAFTRRLFQPERVQIEIDGRPFGTRSITGVVASVVPSPAVGIRALHRAGEGGGFHIVGTEQPPTRLFREAGRLWVGLPVKAVGIDEVAHCATLRFGVQTRFCVDGDLFAADRIELSVTPAVDFLSPAA